MSCFTTLLTYFYSPTVGDTGLSTSGQTPLGSILYVLTLNILT